MPRALQWILTLLALTLATPCAAWEPDTRVRMVDEAVRLMPESLRLALTAHRRDLLIGMLEPMTTEDGPEHRPPWSDGIPVSSPPHAIAFSSGYYSVSEAYRPGLIMNICAVVVFVVVMLLYWPMIL